MSRPALLATTLACIGVLPACARGGLPSDDAGQHTVDAGRHDAGRDAGRHDAGRDAGHDAGPDAGQIAVDAGHDAGPPPVDAGVDSGGGGILCAPTAATLAIVEIMIESRSGTGDLGEWFELENVGACTIDLTGVLVESPTGTGTTASHTIASGTIPPGELFVLAQSGDSTQNHGLPVDYVYGSGIVFNNGADSLRISLGGTEIDNVAWGSTDFRIAASRQLSSTASPTSNGDLSTSAWCDATDVYSSATGGPYRGTPGTANRACP